MRTDIHPNYGSMQVICSCGNSFEVKSTLSNKLKGKELSVDVCNLCHPFYTRQQKIMDTAGRVSKFAEKYGAESIRGLNIKKKKGTEISE